MLIAILWGLGIAFQLANILFSLIQLTHPYGTRRWRVAWGWAVVAHALVIALRLRQAVLMGFSTLSDAVPSTEWEQLMPLAVSVGLFLFNWHIVKIFFASKSRLLHHPPVAQPHP